MNRVIRTSASLLFLLLLCACEVNQSTNKDLITGAYSRGDGLGSDDVIIEVNGKPKNTSTFVFGEKINFIFNDIRGLSRDGGKVFPGLSVSIVKNDKDVVLSYPDLLEHLESGTELSPLQLRAYFDSGFPYRNNEKYKVLVKIWDKKGDGTFSYELPFTIEENRFLALKPNGIHYKNIYLWNESLKQVVFSEEIDSDSVLMLILEGLDGLQEIEQKVYPIFQLELVDSKGNAIISSPNVLANIENEGIDAEEFRNGKLPVTITFSKGNLNNPYRLSAVLIDKNSDKRIDIETELKLR